MIVERWLSSKDENKTQARLRTSEYIDNEGKSKGKVTVEEGETGKGKGKHQNSGRREIKETSWHISIIKRA